MPGLEMSAYRGFRDLANGRKKTVSLIARRGWNTPITGWVARAEKILLPGAGKRSRGRRAILGVTAGVAVVGLAVAAGIVLRATGRTGPDDASTPAPPTPRPDPGAPFPPPVPQPPDPDPGRPKPLDRSGGG